VGLSHFQIIQTPCRNKISQSNNLVLSANPSSIKDYTLGYINMLVSLSDAFAKPLMISSTRIRSSISRSAERIIKELNQSSFIVVLRRFFTIRTLLIARSALQLVMAKELSASVPTPRSSSSRPRSGLLITTVVVQAGRADGQTLDLGRRLRRLACL